MQPCSVIILKTISQGPVTVWMGIYCARQHDLKEFLVRDRLRSRLKFSARWMHSVNIIHVRLLLCRLLFAQICCQPLQIISFESIGIGIWIELRYSLKLKVKARSLRARDLAAARTRKKWNTARRKEPAVHAADDWAHAEGGCRRGDNRCVQEDAREESFGYNTQKNRGFGQESASKRWRDARKHNTWT